ncbi:t-SNARE [Choiromyces venosus 120613-1]|uniref:t-SNARE n=1 Tax=Choiromyces venosus 120613-1 TaxID=1336337 RepID=A0A3N4K9G6_9PEZI|nr:t-SNARE [Choiromyces venosus 120613-1]
MESPLLQNPEPHGQASGYAGHQALPLNSFLNEVTSIRSLLTTFRQAVLDIGALHNQTLQSYDNGATSGSTQRLESLVAETSVLTKQLRDSIKSLERDALIMDEYSTQNTKRQQIDKLKGDFDKELRAYQQTENSFKTRYRDQMARQYRIVNPEATEGEVERMVESGETQVFSQALLSSSRSREANSVYAAVRARQAEIQRIETTLIELLGLFEQMAEQVVLDEPKIMQIEENTTKVERDVEQAAGHMGKAVDSARSARKKKWICLGIGVGIVVVIAIVITVVVVVRNSGNNKNNNQDPKPTGT